jgi:hypothetical protein
MTDVEKMIYANVFAANYMQDIDRCRTIEQEMEMSTCAIARASHAIDEFRAVGDKIRENFSDRKYDGSIDGAYVCNTLAHYKEARGLKE